MHEEATTNARRPPAYTRPALAQALDRVAKLLRYPSCPTRRPSPATLNVVDEAALARVGKTGFALVVESQNQKTGLGARYGTWLLKRGLHPRYDHLGSTRLGGGGLWEQITHQGLSVDDIAASVQRIAK